MRNESTGALEVTPEITLFYRSRPSDAALGRLVAVHGLGDHSGRYGRVATCAAEVGLDFHAIDLRGHGRSEGRRGHASSFGRLLTDLDHFRRHVERAGSGGPTFLLGHSLGGLVVGRYVQEFGFPDLGGAVLVAPFVDLALRPPAWKVGLSDAADRLLPALTMSNEIRSSMLFRMDAEAAAYDGDPLVHHRISARLWGEMRRQADVLLRRAGQTRVPFLVQLPGDDRVVSTPAGEDLARRLGGETRVIEYEGAYHDLYHDPLADRAAADLVAWLRQHADRR